LGDWDLGRSRSLVGLVAISRTARKKLALPKLIELGDVSMRLKNGLTDECGFRDSEQ
jgi:hypothetical protein